MELEVIALYKDSKQDSLSLDRFAHWRAQGCNYLEDCGLGTHKIPKFFLKLVYDLESTHPANINEFKEKKTKTKIK